MTKQIKTALRDYTLAGIIMLPSCIVSFALVLCYLPKLSDRCESLQVTLPMHLGIILELWTKWFLALPWSALLIVTPFILFEFFVRAQSKNAIRKILLLVLVVLSSSINALSVWSMADVQDQLISKQTTKQ